MNSRPRPAQLKVLEGNPGKRKMRRSPIRPSTSDVEPPSHISEAASREWRR